jgi:hypothetical protein
MPGAMVVPNAAMHQCLNLTRIREPVSSVLKIGEINGEMVEKAVKLAEGVGRTIANVDETRQLLNLG